MAQFSRLCDITLAYIYTAFASITHRRSNCSRTYGEAYDRAGWNGETWRYRIAVIIEQWQDVVIMAHLNNRTSRCRTYIEPSHYGIAGEYKGWDGHFSIDRLRCLK